MTLPPMRRGLVAALSAVLIFSGFVVASPAAQADELTSLALVNTNATGQSITLSSQPTPYLFTGRANAADDTVNVLATFSGGTASVTVTVGSGAPSTPVAVVSGVETPVPLTSGENNIVVTHVGTTTTSYTMRIHRGFPITGFEIINADDSSVIISKTGGAFDPADQDDTALVPHGVNRIRARMFYDTPTEPSALPAEGLIWTGCVGCSFDTITSGVYTPIKNLNTGDNRVSFYPTVSPWSNYWGTAWNVRITREAAFNPTSLESLALTNGNGSGGAVNLSAQSTPYLFTGNALAVDDTIDLVTTFSTGTASATVSVGSGAASAPMSLTSGSATEIPLQAGTNNIVVTHVGAATTTYTVRVYRGFPITGYEIINADDSTVIISKTGAAFDPTDRDDTAAVPYGVSRIRARMYYDTPTEPTALPAQGLIWTGCVGCSFDIVDSAQYTPILNIGAGVNRVNFYPTVSPWWNYWGTAWEVRITRAPAFDVGVLESMSLVNANSTGASVNLTPQTTPYLYSGNANAADDTINVLTTFTTGTATVQHSVGAAPLSTPVALQSGVETPVPLSSGQNNIVVTHVGATTTTYTMQIHRGFPITGFEIINADDSTVLISKIGPNFIRGDQDDALVLTHNVYRLRARMFYDTPSEPTALPALGLIWTGCVGCGFDAVNSGEWTPIQTFNVGNSEINFYPTVSPWWNYWGSAWKVRITRASAFAAITNVTVPGAPPAGTPVNAGTTLTATPAGVDGVPTPTVTYDWEATESLVNPDWQVVETTTAPTWTPDNEVANQYVRVTATADNGVSTPQTVTSQPVGPIAEADEAPRFRQTATVSGSASVGSTLTANTGRVTGRPTPTVSYQWEIADDSTSSFAPIAGATRSSYTPGPADEGRVVRVVMTAANGIGSDAVVTTSATTAIQAAAPRGGWAGGDRPSAPRDVKAVARVESARVSWKPPVSAGAWEITHYRVVASNGTSRCVVPVEETSCRVTRLAGGAPVSFQVEALSAAGWGELSLASDVVRPVAAEDVPVELTGKRKGRWIIVTGSVGMFEPDSLVTMSVRFAGGKRSAPITRTVPVSEEGTFTWKRRSNPQRAVVVSAIVDGARSDEVRIAAKKVMARR